MSECPAGREQPPAARRAMELLACDGGGEPEVPDLVCIECG
jgi:hypothetical protein